MRLMDQREREDWQGHCQEFGHAWAHRRQDPCTGVATCRNCGARQIEDIEHEEER